MGFTATGITTTTVTTTQQAPLGFQLTVPTANGGNDVYIYVQADTGHALEVGELCMRETGATTYIAHVAIANTKNTRLIGVAQTAIPAESYGFVLRSGVGSVQASDGGADQQDEALVVAMNGAVASGHLSVDGTAAQDGCHFGFGITDAAASATSLFTARIDCRG